jgi:hypothetical protein
MSKLSNDPAMIARNLAADGELRGSPMFARNADAERGLREAEKEMAKHKTYESAVALQQCVIERQACTASFLATWRVVVNDVAEMLA